MGLAAETTLRICGNRGGGVRERDWKIMINLIIFYLMKRDNIEFSLFQKMICSTL